MYMSTSCQQDRHVVPRVDTVQDIRVHWTPVRDRSISLLPSPFSLHVPVKRVARKRIVAQGDLDLNSYLNN